VVQPSLDIAAAPSVLQRDPLNHRPHLNPLLSQSTLSQRSIKAGTADSRQFTYPLDTQAALHRHHFLYLFVDAVSPELLLP
jgi:hypothetical protein